MGLLRYALKRVVLAIPVLFVVSLIVFGLVELIPGSPARMLLPAVQISPETLARLERELGLNQPIYVRYWKWLINALQGDFGTGFVSRQPIPKILAPKILVTAQMGLVAMFVALMIAIPFGIASAVYKDTWVDNFSRLIAFGGVSIPQFWLGIMIILVFGPMWLDWFGYALIPIGGYAPLSEGFVPWLKHILPPAITLGVALAAILTRLTRSAMVEVLEKEYIQTARSKGIKETTVIMVHGFRNALIPVVTVAGLQIGFIMNGAVVIEEVFALPGVGRLLYRSIVNQNLPVMQATLLFIATVYVMANLLVDLAVVSIDPRIRYD